MATQNRSADHQRATPKTFTTIHAKQVTYKLHENESNNSNRDLFHQPSTYFSFSSAREREACAYQLRPKIVKSSMKTTAMFADRTKVLEEYFQQDPLESSPKEVGTKRSLQCTESQESHRQKISKTNDDNPTPQENNNEKKLSKHTMWLQAKTFENGVESDPHRLAQRQKQIDYGKNTIGYQLYMEKIPRQHRTKSHPHTPEIKQICSKRSWDGQIRKWRQQLHDFDPQNATENVNLQNFTGLEQGQLGSPNPSQALNAPHLNPASAIALNVVHEPNDIAYNDIELDEDGNPILNNDSSLFYSGSAVSAKDPHQNSSLSSEGIQLMDTNPGVSVFDTTEKTQQPERTIFDDFES